MFAARRELTGRPEDAVSLVCTGPIKYVGHKEINADIAHLKRRGRRGAGGRGVRHSDFADQPRDVLREPVLQVGGGVPFALAGAMREEYKAIVDAGFVLQVDDPRLITHWNRVPDLLCSKTENSSSCASTR